QTERIGPRSDLFGLGGILYALLTGRPPHQDADVMGLWEKARQSIVTPPRQINRRIPRTLERICLKALAADPEQRYASAGQFAAALRGFGRRRWFIAALGGVAVLMTLIAVLYQMIPRPTATPLQLTELRIWVRRDNNDDQIIWRDLVTDGAVELE